MEIIMMAVGLIFYGLGITLSIWWFHIFAGAAFIMAGIEQLQYRRCINSNNRKIVTMLENQSVINETQTKINKYSHEELQLISEYMKSITDWEHKTTSDINEINIKINDIKDIVSYDPIVKPHIFGELDIDKVKEYFKSMTTKASVISDAVDNDIKTLETPSFYYVKETVFSEDTKEWILNSICYGPYIEGSVAFLDAQELANDKCDAWNSWSDNYSYEFKVDNTCLVAIIFRTNNQTGDTIQVAKYYVDTTSDGCTSGRYSMGSSDWSDDSPWENHLGEMASKMVCDIIDSDDHIASFSKDCLERVYGVYLEDLDLFRAILENNKFVEDVVIEQDPRKLDYTFKVKLATSKEDSDE